MTREVTGEEPSESSGRPTVSSSNPTMRMMKTVEDPDASSEEAKKSEEKAVLEANVVWRKPNLKLRLAPVFN